MRHLAFRNTASAMRLVDDFELGTPWYQLRVGQLIQGTRNGAHFVVQIRRIGVDVQQPGHHLVQTLALLDCVDGPGAVTGVLY